MKSSTPLNVVHFECESTPGFTLQFMRLGVDAVFADQPDAALRARAKFVVDQ